MLLRQVQAHPLQGHHLRQVRRRGHALEGPPRADGPHQAGLARSATSGTSRARPSRLGILLDISPRNLERILYFALYVVTRVDEAQREKAIAAHRRGGRGADRRAPRPSSTRSAPSSRPPSPTSAPRSRRPTSPRRSASPSSSRPATEELTTAAQAVEASIKEGGKTLADDVVFAATGEVIGRAERDVEGRPRQAARARQGRGRGGREGRRARRWPRPRRSTRPPSPT